MVGGAMWRIKWRTDEIVYAADINHQVKLWQSCGSTVPCFGARIERMSTIGHSARHELTTTPPFTHQGELHLNKASLDQVPRPSLLITDSTNWGREATQESTQSRRQDRVRGG